MQIVTTKVVLFCPGCCHVTVSLHSDWLSCVEQQSLFVMSVFTVVMLAPAAWILHHVPEYRQRSHQSPKT